MLFGENFKIEKIGCGELSINVQHGGKGQPLLLLHGYPQNHSMWHTVAPALAEQFTVICPDLRGYGDSDKPRGNADHSNYSKRVMAADIAALMHNLGHESFVIAAHDRGARVAHRMLLDYPERIDGACIMDITPTHHMLETTNLEFASAYYHWFFLLQPDGLPEKMIGADTDYYLSECLRRWSKSGAKFDSKALAQYKRCFADSATVHASCEDYRAAVHVDLVHDKADRRKRIQCPLLLLWGDAGFVGRSYDVLKTWREYASDVRGHALDAGHFVVEEAPAEVLHAMLDFFAMLKNISSADELNSAK